MPEYEQGDKLQENKMNKQRTNKELRQIFKHCQI